MVGFKSKRPIDLEGGELNSEVYTLKGHLNQSESIKIPHHLINCNAHIATWC